MDIREQKIRLWVQNPPVIKFPVPLNLPKFSKKSFRNYEEMNASDELLTVLFNQLRSKFN